MAKGNTSARGSRSKTAKVDQKKSKAKGKAGPAPKKGKKAKAQDSEDEQSDQESEGDTDAGEDGGDFDGVKISWNEGQLSELLISTIMENREIKQGLFPPPGAHVSTAAGGGKPKADFQRLLAKVVFENHPKYAAAYAESQKSRKHSKIFGEKVKNRLQAMVKMTKGYIQLLGKTGEGITRIEDVDFTAKNEFVNKWREIKDKCPWFLQMRDLVAERPNVVPVGLGNSTTDIDLDILHTAAGDADADVEETPTLFNDDITREILADTSESEIPRVSGDDFTSAASVEELDSSPHTRVRSLSPPPKPSNSRKRKEATTEAPASAPAAPAAAPRSQRSAKKSKLEEFASAALAEEVTRQKELDLALARTQSTAQVAVAREKTKLETERGKREYRLEKLRLKHEREMARMNRQASSSSATPTPALAPAANLQDFYVPDVYSPAYGTTQNTLLPMPPAAEYD